jgi:amino acid transporter
MATLTAHSAQLTALLKSDAKPHGTGAEIAINIAFIVLTTFSHCLGVKVRYGPSCREKHANAKAAVWKD